MKCQSTAQQGALYYKDYGVKPEKGQRSRSPVIQNFADK